MKTAADPEMASIAVGRLSAVGSRAQWLQRVSVIGRLGWGVADQAVSSLTNVAVSLLLVRVLAPAQFGAYGLAYITYGFALSASRGISTEPLMVRFSGAKLQVWRHAVAGCTATALMTGLVAGVFALAAGAVLHGTPSAAFTALGITFPGLLLQDSWRYSFFALGRGSQAFLNDSVWAVTLFPALFLLNRTGHADVFWFVFAWGLTAAIAAAVGPLQARVMPKLSGAWEWVSLQRDLGPRYLMEGTSSSLAVQLRSYGVGFILGLATLGAVSASGTLFGPITILFLGMSLVAIPEGARVLRRSPRHLPLFCALISGGLAAAGLAWGVIVMVAVPRGLGAWLLGPIWRPAYPLLLPQMIFVIGGGIGYGAAVGLHALGASKRSLRQALLWAVVYVVFAVGGAFVAGAEGTVWGAAVAPCTGAVYGWWQLHTAMRESGHTPAGHRFWSNRPLRGHRRDALPSVGRPGP